MSELKNQILEILKTGAKTQAQVAHQTAYSFRTTKSELKELVKEDKVHISGYFVYPNGMYKCIYCLGKKPSGPKPTKPSPYLDNTFSEDLSTVRAILPATASDVYSYFSWPKPYVQKLLNTLVETYTVEKSTRTTMAKARDTLYKPTENASKIKQPIWSGCNVVAKPHVINGVEIRTTWRHHVS